MTAEVVPQVGFKSISPRCPTSGSTWRCGWT